MARPHKDAFLSVRMTAKERCRLDALCRASGLSISSFIRSCLDGVQIRPREPTEIRELYTEINRIGNNINQIARSVNAGIATPEDARQALFLLRQVHELMERIVDK
jgi:pilus assembly protein TadC